MLKSGKKKENTLSGRYNLDLEDKEKLLQLSFDALRTIRVTSDTFIEPITFSVVAVFILSNIAQGVLQEIGAELYRRVTGQTDKMQVALDKMADDIKRYIDIVIEREKINELAAESEEIKLTFRESIGSREHSRLNQCTIQINHLWVRLKSPDADPDFSLKTNELFIGATILKLMILRARQYAFPQDRAIEIRNALDCIRESRDQIYKAIDEFIRRARAIPDVNRQYDCMMYSAKIICNEDDPHPNDEICTLFEGFTRYRKKLEKELALVLEESKLSEEASAPGKTLFFQDVSDDGQSSSLQDCTQIERLMTLDQTFK